MQRFATGQELCIKGCVCSFIGGLSLSTFSHPSLRGNCRRKGGHNLKVGGWEGKYWNVVFWEERGHCTCDLTSAIVTWTRSASSRPAKKSSMDQEWAPRAPITVSHSLSVGNC